MDGVEIAARFGSITNHLKYCGPSDFSIAYKKYLGKKTPENADKLKKTITHFEGHYPYLEQIGKENNLDPFDYKVCEAYWLGNELLENVGKEAMQKTILHGLTGSGKMHIEKAQGLAEKLPLGILPHHSFHVYYIKFITGKVNWNLYNADRCRVPYCKVITVGEKEADVLYRPILFGLGKYIFGEEIARKISLQEGNLRVMDAIKAGDWIATHWDVGIWKLDSREKSNLEKYTKRNIDAINKSL